MATEEEMRSRRCCFTGHRPEKLHICETEAKAWLSEKIDEAIADGYVTFISGMAMGVDLWAAEIVLERKKTNPGIHLIAATPWGGFANRWHDDWKALYDTVWKSADLTKIVCDHYHNGVFQQRNEWMVDHSSRVIACYSGEKGGTRNTIEYAHRKGVHVVVSQQDQ